MAGLALTVLTALTVPSTARARSRKKPPPPPEEQDTAAPVIEHTPLERCPIDVDGAPAACVVRATITDQSGVFDPTLLVRLFGGTAYDRVVMKPVAETPGLYEAEIPRTLAAAGDVEYLIEAFDLLGNGPARVGQEETPLLARKASPPAPPRDTGATGTGTGVDTDTGTGTGTGVDTGTGTGTVAEDNTGLLLGVGVGAGVVVALAAGVGVAFAVYALRAPAPTSVGITVESPSPVAASLLSGGGR